MHNSLFSHINKLSLFIIHLSTIKMYNKSDWTFFFQMTPEFSKYSILDFMVFYLA